MTNVCVWGELMQACVKPDLNVHGVNSASGHAPAALTHRPVLRNAPVYRVSNSGAMRLKRASAPIIHPREEEKNTGGETSTEKISNRADPDPSNMCLSVLITNSIPSSLSKGQSC